MNQAIQELLTTSGRAIIPGIGCLSVNNEEKIVFNSFLTFDDGKITAWLKANEGLDEHQASKKILDWSNELKSTVLHGGEFSLGSIGRFIRQGKDEIEFTSATSSNTPINHSDTSFVQDKIHTENTNENQEKKAFTDNPDSLPEKITYPSHSITKTEVVSESTDNNSPTETSNNVGEKATNSLSDLLNKSKNNLPADSDVPTGNNDDAHVNLNEFDKKSEENLTIVSVASKDADLKESERISMNEEKNLVSKLDTKTDEVNSAIQDRVTSETNDRIVTKKDKTELKEETKHEEVTVNRKRGAFFYVNIILAILILGFGAYAFVYPDQVSQWFGIGKSKSQNVRDSVTTKSKNIDAVDKDTAKIVQNDISEENATVDQPVEQKIETPKTGDILAVTSGGAFHIIVGKFAVRANADRLVQKIKDSGYDGKILRSTEIGHTVSFHTYPTLEEAKNNIDKAKDITKTKAYVEENK